MYEGEQQASRDQPSPTAPPPVRPPDEPRKVTAIPVVPAEPLTGLEVARAPRSEPPTPYVHGESLRSEDKDRSPTNDGPQFEWRREQPHQAPPAPPPAGHSTVSINTTIVVEGSGSGVVVENAVRISLGNRASKKKNDAVERFAEGEDVPEEQLRIAPAEGLPDFVGEAPELRPMLQPISSLAESVQWPKFSVMPMRRRVAFGPPAKLSLFGGSGTPAAKPPAEAKPLPPKKSVGFLFKKLTNS